MHTFVGRAAPVVLIASMVYLNVGVTLKQAVSMYNISRGRIRSILLFYHLSSGTAQPWFNFTPPQYGIEEESRLLIQSVSGIRFRQICAETWMTLWLQNLTLLTVSPIVIAHAIHLIRAIPHYLHMNGL